MKKKDSNRIKLDVRDRGATALCRAFDVIALYKVIKRENNGLLSAWLRYTDRIYEYFRKKYEIPELAFMLVSFRYIYVYRRDMHE